MSFTVTPDKSSELPVLFAGNPAAISLIDWKNLLAPTVSLTGEISYAPLLRVEGEPEGEPVTPPVTPAATPPADGVKDPQAVLNTNQALREQEKKLKDRITGLEAKLEVFAQIDPDKYKLLEQEALEAERLRVQASKDKAELEANYKERVSQLEANYVQTIDQEKEINLKTIHEMLLQQEYVKHGRPEIAHLFRSGHGSRFQLVYEGERPTLENAKLIAVDKDGKPRFVKAEGSSEMVEMGMGEFFKEHKDDPDISLFIPAPTSRGTGTHSLGNYRAPTGGAAPQNAAEAFASLPTNPV